MSQSITITQLDRIRARNEAEGLNQVTVIIGELALCIQLQSEYGGTSYEITAQPSSVPPHKLKDPAEGFTVMDYELRAAGEDL